MTSEQLQDVAIVGGGVIGLATGWQLVRRGVPTSIFERGAAGREASWAAAGMLAPHSEVGFEDEDLLELGLESLRLYPRFLDELREDSGHAIALEDRGTLFVGFDRDDAERLRRLFEFREHLKLPVRWLSDDEARDKEALLSPRVTSAIWVPDDGEVNNRAVLVALREAFARRGGVLREHAEVVAIEIAGARVRGVRTPAGAHAASRVVVAAGCWSNRIEGIPQELLPPVRPVKGQLVSLRMTPETSLRRVIRAPDVYLVPKDDGRLVVGATQEEMGFDKTPTAGPVLRLLERGWEAVPAIYDLAFEGVEVGLRPGSRDNRPVVGETPIEGLYYATGHFRHGIILAPVTAYSLCDLLVEGRTNEYMEKIRPSRFIAPGSRK